jgi:hypothetical protein
VSPGLFSYVRRPYDDRYLTRTVERGGAEKEITVVRRYRRSGAWGELLDPVDPATWIPIPGARDVTVGEYVGSGARRIQRYGEWIEIRADLASSDPALHRWCRQHANSELPSGALRLAPAVWKERRGDELELPFIPEFDHPDESIRTLAGIEAWRREVAFHLGIVVELRRGAVAEAARAGHSRRDIGRLVDLSFARVQQIVAEVESA